MHSDLSVHYSYPLVLSPHKEKKNKEKEKTEIYTKCNLCYSYAHWYMVQFPVASPLKTTENLPNPILEVINHELPYFSICITILNVCLQWPHTFIFQKNIIGQNYMKCVSIMYIPAPTPPR